MRSATLSLDLDNKWSYLKTHGDSSWKEFPSYLDQVVPMALELFDRLGAKATFFIVGQDADLGHESELRQLADSGHEIGNHSYFHEPWLHLKSPTELTDELTRAHRAIERVTGQTPVGFRGPGFSLSRATLSSLAELGYEYDCSTLPMFLGPLARLFYFRSAKLGTEEIERRGQLFGKLSDGLRPIKPYRWDLDGASIAEIPVTTMPLTRLPFHLSYLLYISRFSDKAARAYFGASLRLCRLFGVSPSILVHPLDILGADDVDGLGFFPGMDLAGDTKRARVRMFLEMLSQDFRLYSLAEVCRDLNGSIPTRSISGLD